METAPTALLHLLKLSRHAQERMESMHRQGRLPGPVHLGLGHEGTLVGAACALGPEDSLFGTAWSLAAQLARGVALGGVLANAWGRSGGPTLGRDGDGLGDWHRARAFAAPATIPDSSPQAAGAALAYRIRREPRVAMGFAAAPRTDRWRRSVEASAVHRLPVVWVVENHPSGEAGRDGELGVPAVRVNGSDVRGVHGAAADAVERARSGGGPTIIESAASDGDPVERFADLLVSEGTLDRPRGAGVQRGPRFRAALAASRPVRPGERLVPRRCALDRRTGGTGLMEAVAGTRHAETTFADAIAEGLREEMERDERVVVLRSATPVEGAPSRILRGLADRFGAVRVVQTPASGDVLVGMAIGAAMEGLRPVVELPFTDLPGAGLDELVAVAGTSRYLHRVPLPLVVRGPFGAGVRAGPFHSQSPETRLAHAPGLKVLCPAFPGDAKGLLASAIRDDDPCVFLEHRWLYRRVRGEVADGPDGLVPIGRAEVKRRGEHLTIVAYGAMVHRVLDAADDLADEGISAEVVDLRTVSPLDAGTVLESVARTGRALVVSESPRFLGVGAEVAAVLAEEGFPHLDAPVVRLAPPNVPVPFSPPLEDAYLPQVEDIVEAAWRLAKW